MGVFCESCKTLPGSWVKGGSKQCSAAILSPKGSEKDGGVMDGSPTGTVTFMFTDVEGARGRGALRDAGDRPRVRPRDTTVGLCNLGWMALSQNDLGKAADYYEESLRLAWDTGMEPVILTTLEGYACVAGAQGEAQRAVRLWG